MTRPVAATSVTVEAHQTLILEAVGVLEPLELLLGEAHGSLLAQDLTAPISLPPFHHALLDGYAVRLADVAGASPTEHVTLPVSGRLTPGGPRTVSVQQGFAVRVAAGTEIPDGGEAVVPDEWTDRGRERVAVHRPVGEGDFIRFRGEDLLVDAPVLGAGAFLGAAQIGLLAALGLPRVVVHPRPRVVVISTGDGLADVGRPLGPGQVYDSNSHAVAAACRDAGAVAFRVGPVPDEIHALTEVLEDHLIQADAVVITAGVNPGGDNVVTEVLNRLGSMQFARVAMEPGSAHGFGTVGPDSTPVFALPGDPVAALVAFEVFVRPALRRMLGAASWQRPQVSATLTEPLTTVPGRRNYVRVQVTHDPARGYLASPIGAASGALLVSLAAANALLVVAADAGDLPPGTVAPAMLLDRRGP